MIEIIYGLIWFFYFTFSFFGVYFSVMTPSDQISNRDLPVRILYWNGVVFLVACISVAVLSLAILGARIIFTSLGMQS